MEGWDSIRSTALPRACWESQLRSGRTSCNTVPRMDLMASCKTHRHGVGASHPFASHQHPSQHSPVFMVFQREPPVSVGHVRRLLGLSMSVQNDSFFASFRSVLPGVSVEFETVVCLSTYSESLQDLPLPGLLDHLLHSFNKRGCPEILPTPRTLARLVLDRFLLRPPISAPRYCMVLNGVTLLAGSPCLLT